MGGGLREVFGHREIDRTHSDPVTAFKTQPRQCLRLHLAFDLQTHARNGMICDVRGLRFRGVILGCTWVPADRFAGALDRQAPTVPGDECFVKVQLPVRVGFLVGGAPFPERASWTKPSSITVGRTSAKPFRGELHPASVERQTPTPSGVGTQTSKR